MGDDTNCPGIPSRPSYLALAESGELSRRVRALRSAICACRLCPRACGVNRTEGQRGYCRAGALSRVASFNAHHGEEPPISGDRGSGTVFFAHCTMRCLFCQNYPISQLGNGRDMDDRALADAFLVLQNRFRCHNLNLVTPTHYLHAFLAALETAAAEGFRLPVVYNTSGYETLEALHYLDGVVDVYLPDIKYASGETAREFSDAPDYPERNIAALREMYRQVGDLTLDEEGIARRGLLVRHLVLPGVEEQSIACLERLRDEVSPTCHISLMSQYFPAHKALEHPPLDRRIDPGKYQRIADWVDDSDLDGWVQPPPMV